jgi:hypothetical protein
VQPGAAHDLRQSWKKTAPLTAAGSANSSVMGELYLCIAEQLRHIHKANHCIASVNISYSKRVYEVQPIQSSD